MRNVYVSKSTLQKAHGQTTAELKAVVPLAMSRLALGLFLFPLPPSHTPFASLSISWFISSPSTMFISSYLFLTPLLWLFSFLVGTSSSGSRLWGKRGGGRNGERARRRRQRQANTHPQPPAQPPLPPAPPVTQTKYIFHLRQWQTNNNLCRRRLLPVVVVVVVVEAREVQRQRQRFPSPSSPSLSPIPSKPFWLMCFMGPHFFGKNFAFCFATCLIVYDMVIPRYDHSWSWDVRLPIKSNGGQ